LNSLQFVLKQFFGRPPDRGVRLIFTNKKGQSIDTYTDPTQKNGTTVSFNQYQDIMSHLYNQPGFQIPYSLTIVGTPGFGDTSGIAYDKLITEHRLPDYPSLPGTKPLNR